MLEILLVLQGLILIHPIYFGPERHKDECMTVVSNFLTAKALLTLEGI